jgi:hypothetical protein
VYEVVVEETALLRLLDAKQDADDRVTVVVDEAA